MRPTPAIRRRRSASPRPVRTLPSSAPPDVPEHWTALQHSGQVRLIRGRDEILAERDVGDILERLQLQLVRKQLLRGEIRCLEPGIAELLDLRTVRPAHRRSLAVAAQEYVAGGVDHVEAAPAGVEDAPPALLHRLGL